MLYSILRGPGRCLLPCGGTHCLQAIEPFCDAAATSHSPSLTSREAIRYIYRNRPLSVIWKRIDVGLVVLHYS